MTRWLVRFCLILICVVALPYRSPAPLVFRPGEGWSYEPVGGDTRWQKTRAKDQMEVAEEALTKGNESLALKAARRTVKKWPLSDYAPRAQYIVGRVYEARKKDEKAFKAYQTVLEKYPKIENYNEILERQYDISTRFLNGQWFKIWGVIPFFPSMDKTADMYEKVIKNGPYSTVATKAQMNIGTARENQKDYPKAVKAYERAADRYNDQQKIASDALYKAGLAYQKQAKTAEYDQNVSAQAIATFTDFMTLYPEDGRGAEARKIIESLRTEQARGSFQIAKWYEKKKRFDGALIYYNEVLIKDPESKLAGEARQHIESLKKRNTPPS